MAGPPTADDWRFDSGFIAERLAALEQPARFEEIGGAIVREARVQALPVEIGRDGELRGCRRWLFRLTVEEATFDRFYNGRDGYRGRFWQSPEIGEKANRWLIDALTPKLIEALGGSRDEAFVLKSLAGESATIWLHEDTALGAARLKVAQWEEAASGGSTLSRKARDGRWAALGSVLEVKGAFLTNSGAERIDPDKIERSMELHLAGFT